MKKIHVLIFLILAVSSAFAQVEKHIYELNALDNLLSDEVKEILDSNLTDKRVVFLGEAKHHMGSDLLAKTEFVKYLVLEKGYQDIAFEGDFFRLYFDHNKMNLYSFWSYSIQCQELFVFLKEHNVTIWGFDNQMGSGYTWTDFTNKLTDFLKDNSVVYDESFIEITESYIKNRRKAKRIVGKSKLAYLIKEVEKLLDNDKVIQDKLWFQFLQSYKSDILINSSIKNREKAFPLEMHRWPKI